MGFAFGVGVMIDFFYFPSTQDGNNLFQGDFGAFSLALAFEQISAFSAAQNSLQDQTPLLCQKFFHGWKF